MLSNYNPSVAILMATYNGEKYIKKQIDSILEQTYKNWVLYVLDDGSSDLTINILEEYKHKYPDKIRIEKQKNQGSPRTFLTLACNNEINADFFAFSDQDDEWKNDKLEAAVRELKAQNSNLPVLYCSSALLTNEEGKIIGEKKLTHKTPSFSNALVFNIASGNTMVFNEAARKILQLVGLVNVRMHDWLLYLLVTGLGGIVVLDETPHIYYRQHSSNVIGYDPKMGWFLRIKRLMNGTIALWNENNIEAINKIQNRLTQKSQNEFDQFKKIRSKNRFIASYYLYKSGIYNEKLTRLIEAQLGIVLGKI